LPSRYVPSTTVCQGFRAFHIAQRQRRQLAVESLPQLALRRGDRFGRQRQQPLCHGDATCQLRHRIRAIPPCLHRLGRMHHQSAPLVGAVVPIEERQDLVSEGNRRLLQESRVEQETIAAARSDLVHNPGAAGRQLLRFEPCLDRESLCEVP